MLPCGNPVKQLEQENPKEQFFQFLIAFVDHVPDKVLAHAICRPVGVRKAVLSKYHVGRPRRRAA
jgi:hypothetical protein